MIQGSKKTASIVSVSFQVLLLAVSYYVLISIFSGSDQWKKIDHIYTSIFLVTLIFAITVNTWIIIPLYLKNKRYILFTFIAVSNILFWAFFNQILFDKLIDYILPGYYFISYYDYIDLLKFFFVFVALTTLIQLSREWFQLQEARNRLVTLEKEKIDAELKSLINQVNPHFLFNNLTVLYSLALKGSNETPDAIIKLSEILRYVIYEAASGKVPLKSEVNIIRNYIDLQRYRADPRASIKFSSNIEDENLLIEPMIFLPLVENSFKHGVKNDVVDTFIDIVLQSKDGFVDFKISNNISQESSSEKKYGGIGLKNIEDRLKLVYKNQYLFSVNKTEKSFVVNLKLALKNEYHYLHDCRG